MGTDRTYNLRGKWYRAEELSALVLKALKEDAEAYLQEPIEEAIISVPAYFDDIARKATRKAGQLAGLRVERIINEPSAAALACQYANSQQDAKLLVFDLGGGTLDVSLVDCMDNVIEIMAVSGNNHLGGSDFDRVLAEHFCAKNQMVLGALKPGQQEIILKAAEKAKIDLSYGEETVMRAAFDNHSWSLPVTRQDLIRISASLFKKIAAPIKRVLNDAQVQPHELTRVVMVGGSSKMFVVQQYLKFLLKNVSFAVADPDHMIALGVGIFAGIKERNEDIQDLILTDICPFSLGTNTINKDDPAKGSYMATLIPRNSSLPASHSAKFYTASDNQTRIRIGVYQGEDLYVNNNLYLGELTVEIPAAPEGKEFVEVRFTYDINGLLEVNVTNRQGQTSNLILQNKDMSQEEAERRLKELSALKLHPREQEAHRAMIARGERLYAVTVGELRERVGHTLDWYQTQLSSQEPLKIAKAARRVSAFFDSVEAYVGDVEPFSLDADPFESEDEGV